MREVALVPQEDRARVAVLIVKTKAGDRLLPLQLRDLDQWRRSRSTPPTGLGCERRHRRACSCWGAICSISRSSTFSAGKWSGSTISILLQESVGNRPVLKVGSVDVGPRAPSGGC